MTALTDAQVAYLRDSVNQKGIGHYTFLVAVSSDADRKLGVVAEFDNGEFHSATVGIGDNSNWLTNQDQFKNVVKSVCDALGRP